jgi:hypothetical protein
MDGWFVWWRRQAPADIVARMNKEVGEFLKGDEIRTRLAGFERRRAARARRRALARSSPASRRSGAGWRRSWGFSRSDQAAGLRAVFSAIQRTKT